LALAAREPQPVVADLGVDALGGGLEDLGAVGGREGGGRGLRARGAEGDVLADGAVEERGVMGHDEDRGAQGLQVVVAEGAALPGGAAGFGGGAPGEEVGERGGRRRGGADADAFAGGEVEVEGTEATGADRVEAQPALTGLGCGLAPGGAGREGEDPEDAFGGGQGGGPDGAEVGGEGAEGPQDDLGDADDGDELADGEVAGPGAQSGDEGAPGDEEPGEEAHRADVAALGSGGAEAPAEGLAAGGAVAVRGRVLRAETREDPVPGEEVGGLAGGFGGERGLLPAAAAQRPAGAVHEHQEQGHAQEHDQADLPGDREEDDGAQDDRGELADRVHADHDRPGEDADVGGGDGERDAGESGASRDAG